MQNEINRTNNESIESRLGQFLEELNEIDANTVSAGKYYHFLSNKFRFPDNLFDDIETIDFDCLYSEFEGIFEFDRFDIIEEDLTNIVQDIRLPVLMLWMEDEFLNPLSIGQELFGLLEISEKEFFTSEYICSMIYGNGDDIDRREHYASYAYKIDDFIEKYK